MRVLIYGGRDFAPDKESHMEACAFLDYVAMEYMDKLPADQYGNWLPNVTVVSGGARGADAVGEDWAVVNWQYLEVFKADWEQYGKAAGAIRNQQMLDSGIDLAIEFPGGNGTADMRRRLDKAGVRVIEYKEYEDESST